MIHRLATLSPHRTTPFLFQSALFAVLVGLSDVVAALRFLNGTGSPVWLLVLGAITLVAAPGLFAQAMVLLRSLSKGRPAVWEKDGRLVYLSPLVSSLPVSEIATIDLQLLRRGFGRQEYAVITTRGGKKMHVHLAIISERFDHLKEMIEEL
jgi:hypothetical protein